MALQVNIHEAKTHFSRLLAQVLAGQEVIIAKAGRPVARLVPVAENRGKRLPGTAKGKIIIAPDFNEPLPELIMEEFEK
ncbi:MAG: type II toxin-antitoxin system Phd/YefM family antitoxin [Clostridia bacterium]|nr:MAG: type II toxin-antitoxin system Phd/YefM family antitoxin [Clostridia bacterium]